MINTVNENEADVSNIVLLVGTNSLPRYDQNNVVKKKTCVLLFYLQQEPKSATMYYSAVLPKYERHYFNGINQVNIVVFSTCPSNPRM